jgi:hypothetical protein
MGRFGKVGGTGNAEGKGGLARTLPIAHSGGGALAESAELAFAAVAADGGKLSNRLTITKHLKESSAIVRLSYHCYCCCLLLVKLILYS